MTPVIPPDMIERMVRAAYDALPHNKPYEQLSAFQKDRLKAQVLGAFSALGDTHVMVRKLPESAKFICVLNEDEVLITHPNHRPLIFNLKTQTAEALKAEAQPGSQE